MLSINEIRSITFGAIDVFEKDGRAHFSRFEGSAKEHYGRVGTTSSSVILDFITDASAISFNYYATKIIDRSHCFFDVYENGVLIGHVGKFFEGEEQILEGSYTATLSEGKKRITVYLPNLHDGAVSSIELSSASFFERVKKDKSLLMLGDSITHGYDAYFPSLSYANTVIRELDADGINQAIGGEMFKTDILPEAATISPDYITVAYGTNDWSWSGKTLEECVEKEKAFFAKLKGLYPDAKIFYISPLYRGDNHRITTLGDFKGAVKAFSEVAREYGAEVIDGVKLIPHSSLMFEDKYLHPNDLGFTQYANALLKELALLGLKR